MSIVPDKFELIGIISKPLSYKGKLKVKRKEGVQLLNLPEFLLLLRDQEYVPYYLEEFEEFGDSFYLIKLDEIDTEESARALRGSGLYVQKEFVAIEKSEHAHLYELVGYLVIDKNHGEVGIIEEIIDNGSQQILQIVRGEYEVLVPAVDAFMIKRDEETRTLQIEAPDGLIDLYS